MNHTTVFPGLAGSQIARRAFSTKACARAVCQGFLALASMASVAQAQTAAPLTVSCATSPNVFNTGFNHVTSGSLVNGQADPYWAIAYAGPQTGLPTPLLSAPAYPYNWGYYGANPVVNWTTPWVTSPYSNANWIGPFSGSLGAAGQAWRYYRYRFNLDPAVNPADLSLQLSYYADDQMADIYVNGVAQSTHGPVQGASFTAVAVGVHTLTQDWQPGANELVFLVRDYGWVTGLLVQALPSSVCRPAPVEVTKTASVSQVHAGESLSYEVTVRNQGSQSTTLTTLTDAPPAGLTLNAWTCAASNGAVCPASSGTGAPNVAGIVLPPAAIAGGAGGQLTYTVQATVAAGTPPGNLTNRAVGTPDSASTVCAASSGGAGAAVCEAAADVMVLAPAVQPTQTPVPVPVNAHWALLVLAAIVGAIGGTLGRRRHA